MSIRDYLQSRHIWFETVIHRPAACASKRARSIQISGRCVAKGVLIKTKGGDLLVVLPATHRVDLPRLARILGEDEVRIATEDEVSGVFNDCERGALPPFGLPYGLKTIVDVSLAGNGDFVFVANARHEAIRMHYRDYERLETPLRARFALSAAPRRRRLSHRKAG
jgi:Ala-tRNA(Pro) deacylase